MITTNLNSNSHIITQSVHSLRRTILIIIIILTLHSGPKLIYLG